MGQLAMRYRTMEEIQARDRSRENHEPNPGTERMPPQTDPMSDPMSDPVTELRGPRTQRSPRSREGADLPEPSGQTVRDPMLTGPDTQPSSEPLALRRTARPNGTSDAPTNPTPRTTVSDQLFWMWGVHNVLDQFLLSHRREGYVRAFAPEVRRTFQELFRLDNRIDLTDPTTYSDPAIRWEVEALHEKFQGLVRRMNEFKAAQPPPTAGSR